MTEEEDEFLRHVLTVMAHASIGNLSVRVTIPEWVPQASSLYKISAALNVLLSDLETRQEDRVRNLAEEAITKALQAYGMLNETKTLIEQFNDRYKYLLEKDAKRDQG